MTRLPSPPAPRVPDRRHRASPGTRFRFALRLAALAGVLAIPIGGGLLSSAGRAFPPLAEWSALGVKQWATMTADLIRRDAGAAIVAGGAAVILLWALAEAIGVAVYSTGRRSAVGVNTTLQVGLAVTLLVVVNAVSFDLFRRFDLTTDQRFTLDPGLVAELQALRADSPTTVVVVQLKKSGVFTGEPDAYDVAAEAVAVEKVRDLVAQLREFGPQFRVEVLDRKAVDFDKALAALTAARPGLADAVRAAPESSLFFYADEKVTRKPTPDAERLLVAGGVGPRPSVAPDPSTPGTSLVYPAAVARMGFSDFLALDKVASRDADGGSGNLVLLPRGPEAFVRKVLSIEERRPRVGLAVIHPVLSSRDTVADYSAPGLRAALERNGFDVTDVILKKWTRVGPPTPAATTYDETDLERAEARYDLLTLLAADRDRAVAVYSAVAARTDKLLAAIDAAAPADRPARVADAVRGLQPNVNVRLRGEADVRRVRTDLGEQAAQFKAELAEFTTKAAEAGTQLQDRLRNERTVESRRLTDVKAKFAGAAADCDVLIVPRLTVTDITRGQGGTIPSSLFSLSADQAGVVKEFLKQGKPVLFAVGPQIADSRPGLLDGPDDVERLLPQLGILPSRQTVLTDDEATAIAEQAGQEFGASAPRPLLTVGRPTDLRNQDPDRRPPNPVGAALEIAGRSAGAVVELRAGGLRPLTASDALKARSKFDPEFLFTGPTSFNEDKPIATDDYTPKFDPARPDDPKRGTPDEERRGPFAVGVAAEVPIPAGWFDPPTGPTTAGATEAAAVAMRFDLGLTAGLESVAADTLKRGSVRVVAIGTGALFVGKTLDPGPETLVVAALNWQLRRDDKLPKPATTTWQYPRAHLDARGVALWRFGTLVYLPLLVGVVGAGVLMVRRLR